MAEHNGGVSIVDMVSEGRYEAMFLLRNFFEVEKIADLAGWVPVISAMQGLSKQIMEDVAMPLLARFFEEEALDPTAQADQAEAAPFAPILSENIQTAVQVIVQSMQQQERSRQNLLQGVR